MADKVEVQKEEAINIQINPNVLLQDIFDLIKKEAGHVVPVNAMEAVFKGLVGVINIHFPPLPVKEESKIQLV